MELSLMTRKYVTGIFFFRSKLWTSKCHGALFNDQEIRYWHFVSFRSKCRTSKCHGALFNDQEIRYWHFFSFVLNVGPANVMELSLMTRKYVTGILFPFVLNVGPANVMELSLMTRKYVTGILFPFVLNVGPANVMELSLMTRKYVTGVLFPFDYQKFSQTFLEIQSLKVLKRTVPNYSTETTGGLSQRRLDYDPKSVHVDLPWKRWHSASFTLSTSVYPSQFLSARAPYSTLIHPKPTSINLSNWQPH